MGDRVGVVSTLVGDNHLHLLLREASLVVVDLVEDFQKPSPRENRTSTSTNASSSLINGAPPRRYSRRRFVLSRRPHTQILRKFVFKIGRWKR
ncbi:hypothetical protein CFP56_027227 [Quercus suber]|uniref:Uncharacterized protein n=1 Tax=Quercus suber TaxID=58331 RepID=A0AAW0JZ69_QUESU